MRCLCIEDILNAYLLVKPQGASLRPEGSTRSGADGSCEQCPHSPPSWFLAVLLSLPELLALCNCGVIPSFKAGLGVAPALPLRRGHRVAILQRLHF